jgi:glycosyltransferase involved in cell wall biosynthesis
MDRTIDHSIVIPVFNEEDVILEIYSRLRQVMEGLNPHYELLFVDDGSTDTTTKILKELCHKDSKVKLLIFSRNFGQQAALSAGIDCASGKAVVLMDADLQDPPEVIPKMIKKWKQGYDVVYAKRTKRKGENFAKRLTAALFYRLLKSLTDREIPVDVGDFRLIDRKVCDSLKNLREKDPYLRGLISWVGFKQTKVEYVREERWAGATKYYFNKRLNLAIDAILSFSYKPLKIALPIGFTLSSLSLIYLIIALYQKLFTQDTFVVWAFILAINIFFNGILLIVLGIVGGYIARIYEELKDRPPYIVADKRGFTNNENA